MRSLDRQTQEKILQLASEGKSYRAIHERLGVGIGSVHNVLHKQGLMECQHTQISSDFMEFSQVNLAPLIHPLLQKPSTLFDYQIDLFNLVQEHKSLAILKARKIGITETILRIIAYKALHECKDSQIVLSAGNRMQIAVRIMKRFQNLFTPIEDHVIDKTRDSMTLSNGCEIVSIPCNESPRGIERCKIAFIDECAFTGLIDDSFLGDAFLPLLLNTDGNFIVCSTGNGCQGWFYDIFQDSSNSWHKVKLPYTVSIRKLLDERTVNRLKNDRNVDFQQEMECAFTSPKGSYFDHELLAQCLEDYELIPI